MMLRKVLAAQSVARVLNGGTPRLRWLLAGVACLAVAVIGLWAWAIGCRVVAGSGTLVTKGPKVSAFTRIEVDGPFRVSIRRDRASGVHVTANENMAQYVQTRVEGHTLRVSLQGGRIYEDATLGVNVTLAELSSLSLDGGCKVRLQGFNKLLPVRVSLDGESRLRAVDLRNTNVTLQLAGSSMLTGTWVMVAGRFAAGEGSRIDLTGAVERLTLTLAGASTAHCARFRADRLNGELLDGSSAVLHVTGAIDAYLRGASTLEYYGTPTLDDVKASDDSELRQAEQ